MVDLIAQSIPKLSVDQLIAVAKDVEYRIGPHVAGGMPVDEYVERQKSILTMIQDELVKR